MSQQQGAEQKKTDGSGQLRDIHVPPRSDINPGSRRTRDSSDVFDRSG